jgi:DNA modification methylase
MIQHLPISKIHRAEYNPRYMPDSEMEALMRSLAAFGFVEPIVVNARDSVFAKNDLLEPPIYVLVGGHQRTTATERLIAVSNPPKGVEEKDGQWMIPAMVVHLSLEEEQALNLALNKIRGRWDELKLGEIIIGLKETTILPATGFRDDEISRILDASMPETELGTGGEIPEPTEPRSKPGEIYQLGPHRLIVGDSTDPAVFEKLMAGKKASMVWTDPPYNVAYKSTGRGLLSEGKESIKNDNMSATDFKTLIDRAFAAMHPVVEAGGAFYVCSGWQSYPVYLDAMMKLGMHQSGVITWVKPGGTLSYSDYRHQTEIIAKAKKEVGKTAESIIYGWKEGTHRFYGENEFDVWEMPRKSTQKYIHPTEKPDWLPMRALRNSSKRGEIVLDPFAGSGSVMAAADKTGRSAYMIELDPKFADVIRDRWDRMEKGKQDKEQNI